MHPGDECSIVHLHMDIQKVARRYHLNERGNQSPPYGQSEHRDIEFFLLPQLLFYTKTVFGRRGDGVPCQTKANRRSKFVPCPDRRHPWDGTEVISNN